MTTSDGTSANRVGVGVGVPVRVGVVGCGRVAQDRHLPLAASLPGVELRALCEVDSELRGKLQERYSPGSVHERYEDLVGLEDLDAVMIAAPTSLHAEVGVAALRAGKHVMIEKPLALSLDDVDALEEAATQSGKTVAVAMNSRWHRLAREAREVIRQGTLGRLGLVRSAFTDDFRLVASPRPWMMQHAEGGCVLIEQAVHHFDLWQFLLDSPVEEIHATMREPMAAGERAAITATLANGVIVSAIFTEGFKAINELEVFGEDGMLSLSLYDFDGLCVRSRTDYPGTLGPRIRGLKESLLAFPGALKRKKTGGDWVGSYRAEWTHFLECIREGKPVECGLAEGRRALRVSLAAMASLHRRAPVRVDDAPSAFEPWTG